MQLRATSIVDDYQWIYPADTAIAYPEKPGEDATQEAKEAHVAAVKHVHDEIEAACESGNFDRVPCKPGEKPAVWTLQHVRGRALRWLVYRSMDADRNEQIAVTHAIAAHALVGVRGLFDGDREFEIRREFDRELGFEAITSEQMELLCGVDSGLLISLMAARVQASINPKKKASTGAE